MNTNNLFRGALRRWYVLVAGLILTGILVSVVGSHVTPTYTRNATQVLVPGTKSYPEGDNAYLYTGNLTQAADVLVDALSTDQVDGPITAAHPGSTIDVETGVTTDGPVISVAVTGKSNADAAAVLDGIVAQISPVLLSLQQKANVPSNALIKSVAVTSDTSSQVSQKARLEVMGGAGVVGIAISVLLAFIVDSIVVGRRAARIRRSGSVDPSRVHDGEDDPTETVSVSEAIDDAHDVAPAPIEAPALVSVSASAEPSTREEPAVADDGEDLPGSADGGERAEGKDGGSPDRGSKPDTSTVKPAARRTPPRRATKRNNRRVSTRNMEAPRAEPTEP